MSKGFDFLCVSCALAQKHNYVLNRTSDIAYSMPDLIFKKLHEALEKDHSALAKEINSHRNLISCITWDDIEKCVEVANDTGTILSGTYTLDSAWLKENCKRFQLSENLVSKLPDSAVFIREYLNFYYIKVNNQKFPDIIRSSTQKLLSDERRCSKCGQLLSPATGKAKELRILLQGSSRAGKTSSLIAVLHALLENDRWQKSGFRSQLIKGDGPDAEDIAHYHNWINQQLELYRKGFKVDKTDLAINLPILHSLLVKVDNREFVLTFVDMPGEFFDNADPKQQDREALLNLYMPIYNQCHVIWTCLRYETIIPQIFSEEQWKKLDQNTGLSKDLANCMDFEKYAHRMESLSKEYHARNYEPPVHAVILTMTDGITSVHTPAATEQHEMEAKYIIPGMNTAPIALIPPGNKITLDERICYRLCYYVSSYIREKNPRIPLLFQNFSEQTKYFALAAYGHPAVKYTPENAPTAKPPEPFHVEVPLLWSMAVSGFLPIKYAVDHYQERNLWSRVILGQSRTQRVSGPDKTTYFNQDDPAFRNNLLRNLDEYQRHVKGEKK